MLLTTRMATKSDAHLPAFDFTKLTAINTCPTYGILRYSHHKTMSYGGRAMALEAGKIMHDCFAMVRLYQLGYVQNHVDLMILHGERLFGKLRWEELFIDLLANASSDHRVNARNMCWGVLNTGNYVDDPDDKKRTYANLEAAIAYYVDRWDFTRYPVWIRDPTDPKSDAGVEIGFDVVTTITDDEDVETTFRLIGRIDGLHVNKDGTLLIHENKTASRMDRAWRASFEMSHQPTGYCIAAAAFANQHVEQGVILGLTIPLSSKSVVESVLYQPVMRLPHMMQQWMQWAVHTVELHQQYRDNVSVAPKYTHSCNRYFRACQFIPYCTSDDTDKQYMFEAMPVDEWSPLAEEAGD